MGLRDRDPFAVDPNDGAFRVDLGAELGDHGTVNLDATLGHERLALAPTGNASLREHLLQPHQPR